MEKLLVKQELQPHISKAQFTEDLNCLFDILQTSYGAYEYFGPERFLAAKRNVEASLADSPFEFRKAVSLLRRHLHSFIKDGHFRIGEHPQTTPSYDYAVRYSHLYGIPVIDCKKFWYDTNAERMELELFSASAPRYAADAALILDLRDNPGGSDVYIWEFIKGLYGVEPDYPHKFMQKYSPLFRASLRENGFESEANFEQDVEVCETPGQRIPSSRPIYVLINENTASSGESAVACLKTVESAVLVGSHSAGCFTCGNCITAYLPHSHLPIYFGTGLILYEGHRNIDAEGGFQADLSFDEWKERLEKGLRC